jgi:hypothetical protein
MTSKKDQNVPRDNCAPPAKGPGMLKKDINTQQITFYLKSCKYFRFPFFDPTNCYRRDGLFGQLEDSLYRAGDELTRRYGSEFISINLRGSWLRGIPIQGDDVDVLFIVNGLPEGEVQHMREYTGQILLKANPLFRICEGKIEYGMKVDPIIHLDLARVRTILNTYMYGLGRFLQRSCEPERDTYQDAFMGSNLTEKKTQFLKSGILIPYVGWVYGRERKQEVFEELSRYLPIPTRPTMLYSEEEVDETKETIRQAFVARNLIYPSLEIKKWVDFKALDVHALKEEAVALYPALEPLEDIQTRAIVNYIYTLEIEKRFLGEVVTRERVSKFAPNYDQLVFDILEMAYLRMAKTSPD